MSDIIERPASRAAREVAFADAENDAGPDDVNRLFIKPHLLQVPVVFFLISLVERPERRAVGDLFGHSFEDHRLVGAVGRDHAMWVGAQVPRLTRLPSGAEIERVV